LPQCLLGTFNDFLVFWFVKRLMAVKENILLMTSLVDVYLMMSVELQTSVAENILWIASVQRCG